MLDVRFERPMDEVAQSRAEKKGVSAGGDLMEDQTCTDNDENEVQITIADMRFQVQPKFGVVRDLQFGEELVLVPGTVYELPLAALTETDDSPARLDAGDILVMEAALKDSKPNKVININIWHSELGKEKDVNLYPAGPVACTLRLVLTDEPVVEPPPALYAALLRTKVEEDQWRIGVPLHAQSPLPWRVDLVEPARDFRKGLMRRHANFIWTLLRPRAELIEENALYVMKSDRNGQTYLPDVGEFQTPEKGTD